MKFFLTLGGFLGFTLALAASLHAGNEPAFALRDGAIGCLVGAFILRLMHAVLLSSIRTHILERAEAEKAAALKDVPPSA